MAITQNPIYKHGEKAVEIDISNWRQVPKEERDIFFDWVLEETIRKNQDGHERYGNDFVGDPLIHLAEELLDAMFYVYVAFKQRQALETSAQAAVNENQKIKNFQLEIKDQVSCGVFMCTEILSLDIFSRMPADDRSRIIWHCRKHKEEHQNAIG